MAYLVKTEPDCYSWADLARDRETVWDGVTNPQAVKFLRQMHKNERLVIYHTGTQRAAVGTATVVSVDAQDPKVPMVRIKVGKAIEAKSLDAIREEPLFHDSPLVRQSRLSVVPLTQAQYEWLIA
jgi:predicted RNA-binding protein with PUA-like domain